MTPICKTSVYTNLAGQQNPTLPQLGAAGTMYSRTVKPKVVPLGALPHPETIFESVMAREGFKRNPNNVSSILWYWATIIIHGESMVPRWLDDDVMTDGLL